MKKKSIVVFRSVLPIVALCGFLVAGCQTREIIDDRPIPVTITQNSDGLVTLSWPSMKGYNYRLIARDYDKRMIVMAKTIYQGTGDTITVQFKRDPNKTLPTYSARPEKATE